MNAPRSLTDAARRLGATIEVTDGGDWVRCLVCAPPGSHWAAAAGTHCLVAEWRHGDRGHRDAEVADALERMALGLAPCEDPECDYCCE